MHLNDKVLARPAESYTKPGSKHIHSQNYDGALSSYLTEIGRTKILDRDTEQLLAIQIINGDKQAKDQLIRAHLRYVVTVAKKYVKKRVSIEDLIGEGNRGLMIAVEKFDPYMGVRFLTYAAWWIKQTIIRYILNHDRSIRLPVHRRQQINRYKKALKQLTDDLGRAPTYKEKVEGLPFERKVIDYFDKLIADSEPLSIQQNISEDGDAMLDILDDKKAGEEFRRSVLGYHVRDILPKVLEPREYSVVSSRFGLEGEEPKTLEEIGHEQGVSRERIRQIEARALNKLRDSARVRGLRDFL